ncbi:hypothetical protein C0991_008030 [Blastosporella zonata]|nr:hypothetical protein C0991_008030 [Blastosporella zonata]
MEQAKLLDKALACRECKWIKISPLEQQARAKNLQEKVANGEVPAKPARAPRADKGRKRGPQKLNTGTKRGHSDHESNGEDHGNNAHHSRKKRRGKKVLACQLPPMPLSKELVDSESSSDNNSD